jgi:hypothetical protein
MVLWFRNLEEQGTFACAFMWRENPFVGVENQLYAPDDRHRRMWMKLTGHRERKGSPMGYSFSIDMRNVTHYSLP